MGRWYMGMSSAKGKDDSHVFELNPLLSKIDSTSYAQGNLVSVIYQTYIRNIKYYCSQKSFFIKS